MTRMVRAVSPLHQLFLCYIIITLPASWEKVQFWKVHRNHSKFSPSRDYVEWVERIDEVSTMLSSAAAAPSFSFPSTFFQAWPRGESVCLLPELILEEESYSSLLAASNRRPKLPNQTNLAPSSFLVICQQFHWAACSTANACYARSGVLEQAGQVICRVHCRYEGLTLPTDKG